jgi:thiol-disulfide isomerase/thioredoxin
MSTTRALLVRVGLAVAILAAVASADRPIVAAQDPDDPKFVEAMTKGDAALKQRRWQEALDAYKSANSVAKKRSARALLGMSRAYHGLGAFKTEADTCLEALKQAAGDQAMESTLHNQRGLALLDLALTTNKPTLVKDAEAAFRAALAVPNAPLINHFNLGVSLLKQGRDDDGIASLKTFVDSGARAPEIEEARRMIENPRRARVAYAPEFNIATMSGEYLSLKDLQGKTVLLDFWGTWCAPCLAATPALTNIYRKFSKPSSDGRPAAFEMIGVSSDSKQDEPKLRDYIGKNNMLWPQLHDLNRQIQRIYQVNTYPTYIVVDPEGVIRERLQGWSMMDSPQRIDNAIRKAMREPAGK